MICDQTIVVIRAGAAADRYHNAAPDWSSAAHTTVVGVSVQPEVQQETSEPGRQAATTGYRVISDLGIDVDVTASDRVEFDGVTYEVNGDVARWPDPISGLVDHVEFSIVRVRG